MRRLPTVAALTLAIGIAVGSPLARAASDDAVGGGRTQDVPPLRAGVLVPSREFPTIQSAIDAAVDGATIRIRPGVHREVLTISGKRLRLTGAGGRRGAATTIVGPTALAGEAAGATGLVNYLEGGGGVLEHIALRGGANGIVGQPPTPRAPDDTAGGGDTLPPTAASLHVTDVAVENTGRGILWRTGTDLVVSDTQISRVRKNGVVFNSFTRPAVLKLVDVSVEAAAKYGVLVMNTSSIGCANQLTNVYVAFAEAGGIGVFNSGVCISGGVLSFNHDVGIYLQKSAAIVDGTRIQSTLYTVVPGGIQGGHGILALASDLQLVTNCMIQNQPAGLTAYGSSFTLAFNTFNCNSSWDLGLGTVAADAFGPGDPPGPLDATPHDGGGNVCGCGANVGSCVSVGGALAPPPQDSAALE